MKTKIDIAYVAVIVFNITVIAFAVRVGIATVTYDGGCGAYDCTAEYTNK